MTSDELRIAELSARRMAHGCPVYAPKQGTDEGEALYRATRSGVTSASCGKRWMDLRSELKARGVEPLPIESKEASE